MFIIELTYIKPIEEIEKHLAAHILFLEKHYQTGYFICSGRKSPRTGGIIICNAEDINQLDNIINEDPFSVNAVATYAITEFIPTKYADEFSFFVKNKS